MPNRILMSPPPLAPVADAALAIPNSWVVRSGVRTGPEKMKYGLRSARDAGLRPVFQTEGPGWHTLLTPPPSPAVATPQIQVVPTGSCASPACSRKTRSALPSPSCSARQSGSPPQCPLAHCSGTAAPGTPPVKPCTALFPSAAPVSSLPPPGSAPIRTGTAFPSPLLLPPGPFPFPDPVLPAGHATALSNNLAVRSALLLVTTPAATLHNRHTESATPATLPFHPILLSSVADTNAAVPG